MLSSFQIDLVNDLPNPEHFSYSMAKVNVFGFGYRGRDRSLLLNNYVLVCLMAYARLSDRLVF